MAVAASAAGCTVRPATAADLPEVHDVLNRSGLRSGSPAALAFYRACPGGRLVVADQGGRVTGTALAVGFGRTGWLGNVAVDPAARGQGIGTAVSAAAIGWLRQAGVVTVLLTATDLGRPVYERLGFTDEGVRYGIWLPDPPARPAGGDPDPPARPAGGDLAPAARPAGGDSDPSAPAVAGEVAGVRALGDAAAGPAGIPEIIRLDAEATGEDRGDFLRAFAGRVRVPAGFAAAGSAAPGGTGYRVPLPWGGGPVVASGPDAARALLGDMLASDPDPSLAFPLPNAAAAGLAAALGFRLARQVTRMRLGPPVTGFRPERIFNVFSLAVG